MKTRFLVLALPVLLVLLGWQERSAAQCAPNGHIFNLESLTDASLSGQSRESVALLPNRAGQGDDLVYGAALDPRPFDVLTLNEAFYVQRATSDCAAAFDGGIPPIGSFKQLGSPAVAADPAHDQFFVADLRFQANPDVSAIGVLRATATRLLNPSDCPNGTIQNPLTCFEPAAALIDQEPLNVFQFSPAIAVDQRASGTGNGDVYVAYSEIKNSIPQIGLAACTSLLHCGSPIFLSVAKNDADTSVWIQVRADGLITLSYQDLVPSNGLVFPQYSFVTCTPHGAPNPPTCGNPVLVAQPQNPPLRSVGETAVNPGQQATHVNRLESDGKTFTTFLAYQACDVPSVPLGFCPKVSVFMNFSTDGGKTWSLAEKVSASPGQQFQSSMALDASTQTVNIAYYSTEKDPQKRRTQIFLSQILPGTTFAALPHQLTSIFFDRFFESFGASDGYGGLSVAAAGTGNAGQSKVYVHYTGSTVNGSYNGLGFPIITNTLTRFAY